VNAAIEAFLRFRIDISLPDQAAEGHLDMAAGAAEAIVEVEVAEGGVEVIPPEQIDYAPSQPDAFRVGGGAC
jgi:hypothetical protein